MARQPGVICGTSAPVEVLFCPVRLAMAGGDRAVSCEPRGGGQLVNKYQRLKIRLSVRSEGNALYW